MNRNTWKKLGLFTCGSLVMGFGIGICNYANLGVDPMSVLVAGTYQRCHVSFGMMNFLICLIQLAATFCLEKRNITVATFVAMVTTSLGIELFALLPLPDLDQLGFQIIWLIIGVITYCLGLAFSQFACYGYTTYDGVIFGIQKYTKWSYHQIRWLSDLTYLLLGYWLGGAVGICTIVILLFAGKLIEFFLACLKKRFQMTQGG